MYNFERMKTPGYLLSFRIDKTCKRGKFEIVSEKSTLPGQLKAY